jgi:hypothetical protein
MGIVNFYKNMVRGSYESGHRLTARATKNMTPRKASFLGTLADVALGGLVAFFSVPPILHSVAGAVAAVTAAVTLPAVIPSALLAIGGAALSLGLGIPMVAMGVGFLGSARERMHIPAPTAVFTTAGHAVNVAAHTVASPFKWAGHQLSHAFSKAHDGADKILKPLQKRIPGRPGHFDI